MFENFEMLFRCVSYAEQSIVCLSGISGSGKSFIGEELRRGNPNNIVVVSADHFFNLGNGYRWYGSGLKLAHEFCFNQFLDALDAGKSVVIDNTNVQLWHFEKFKAEAKKRDIPFYLIFKMVPVDVATARCVHDVPSVTISNQDESIRALATQVTLNEIEGIAEYGLFYDSLVPHTIDHVSKHLGLRVVLTLQGLGYDTYIMGGWATEVATMYIDQYLSSPELTLRAMDATINDVDIITSAPPEVVQTYFNVHCTNSRMPECMSLPVLEGISDMINITSDVDGNHTHDFIVNAVRWNPYPKSGEDPVCIAPPKNLGPNYLKEIFESPKLQFHSTTSADDDPHRSLLRMIRLSVNKGYPIDQWSWYTAWNLVERLKDEPFCGVSPERVFEEMTKILTGGNAGKALRIIAGLGIAPTPNYSLILTEEGLIHPDTTMKGCISTSLLELYFPFLRATIGCEQPEQFHKEGSVWQHILLMLDNLAKDCDPALAWAVLLHDVGKPSTKGHDKKNDPDRITFYGHQDEDARIASEVLGHGTNGLKASDDFRLEVMWLCKNHMNMHNWIKQMKSGTRKELASDTERFGKLIELNRLDSVGSMDHPPYLTVDAAKEYMAVTRAVVNNPLPLINGRDLMAIVADNGLDNIVGQDIGDVLRWIRDRQLNGKYNQGGRDLALNHAKGRLHQAHTIRVD